MFDFKTQVQQFIEFDKKRWQLPGRHAAPMGQTVFTVLFGTWDLLHFSTLDKEASVRAIDRSIQELFLNLDILADHIDTPMVAIPNLMDITLLPRFSDKRNDSAAKFAMEQHQAVFMWSYWNTALSRAASEWNRGYLLVPNVHDIVVNAVRAKQMYAGRISDAHGNGKQEPLFAEVEKPCLAQESNSSVGNLEATAAQPCSNPGAHLFW